MIAEPGRLLSESYSHLVSNIIGTKVSSNGHRNYYVNTGLYQAYFYPRLFGEPGEFIPVCKDIESREKHQTTFWGQTCDSVDYIYKNIQHPMQHTGEWVITRDFGAYHCGVSSNFNGFYTKEIFL